MVFLTDSVITGPVKSRLKDTGYKTIPKIWDDNKQLNATSDYLDKTYLKLERKLCLLLKEIHAVDYPPSFWEIPMASWLLHYLHALYDRYARLKSAVELYGTNNVTVLSYQCHIKPPSSFRACIENTSESEQHVSALYGSIAKQMGIPVYWFTTKEEPKELLLYKDQKIDLLSKNFYSKAIRKLKDELSVPIPLRVYKERNILVSTYYFNKSDRRFFINKLSALFMKKKQPGVIFRKIDRNILTPLTGDDIFESIAIKLLPLYMPTYLLEEFRSYHELAKKWDNFRVYFSDNGWYPNILFCYAASLGRLQGAKIAGCQHGGGYGQYERSHAEFLERKLCDFYVTWGWKDSLYPGAELLPLPQPYLSRYLNKYRGTEDYALWCGTSMPKQAVRFMRYIPDLLQQYMSGKHKFISRLDMRVRKALVYRPHAAADRWGSEDADIFMNYPEVRIEGNGYLPELLQAVKLFICDHQSTAFLESLVINTPTILFWGHELIDERKSAIPLFDMLRKAGILFHDPIKAAEQVNAIWGDIEGWWLHPDRQTARRKFMDNFCHAAPEWQKEWENTFKKLCGEQ